MLSRTRGHEDADERELRSLRTCVIRPLARRRRIQRRLGSFRNQINCRRA